MKSKLFIASAALSTFCFIYLVKLFDQADVGSAPITAQAVIPGESTISSAELEAPLKEYTEAAPTVKTTVLVLNAEESTTCYGPCGTRLDFPSNCFVDESGRTVKGKVRLSLQECYDVPEMLKTELSTTSDGRLLETAGMINLVATKNGRPLKIADGITYTISFPKNGNEKTGLKLFYGARDEDGLMNWELANEERDIGKQTEMNDDNTASGSVAVTNSDQALLPDNQNCFIQICESYLRRSTKVSEMDYFNWELRDGRMMNQWFVSNFNPDLKMLNDFCSLNLRCQINFKVNRDGTFKSYYISSSSFTEYDNRIVEFLKTMPALNLDRLMPLYTDDHSCILTFSSFRGEMQSDLTSGFRQQFSQQPDSAMKNVDANALDYYVLNSSKLGWINCDRFYDEEGELVDFYVMSNGSNSCNVSMVFDDINSIVRGSEEDGVIVFRGIPANRRIRLIGIDNQDGTPVMSVASGNTSEKNKTLTTYKPFSINQLDALFASAK